MDSKTVIIHQILSTPLASSLLSTHPNDLVSSDFLVPQSWTSWWEWASCIDPGNGSLRHPKWISLVRYYNRTAATDRPLSPDLHSCEGKDTLKEHVQTQFKKSVFPEGQIPDELASLIDNIRCLQLKRDLSPMSVLPDAEATRPARHSYGMSPKKDHEVTRMSTFISELLNRRGLHSLRHAVDVGSGQGYLSRALQDMGVHVLALDSNQTQTSGAERWQNKAATRKQSRTQKAVTRASNVYAAEDLNLQISCFESSPTPWTRLQGTNHDLLPKEGIISHKTVHITPQTLQASIQDWLLSDAPGIGTARNVIGDISVNESDRPAEAIKAIPVLLVALHACGSLTPDILRTFVSNHRGGANSNPSTWKSQALVVVGCCYNLMSPADFPLSTGLRRSFSGQKLSLASLHLAAQVPSQWARTASSLDGARLAVRKVVYRALLQPLLQTSVVLRNVHMPGSNHEPDIASEEEARRGKLAGTGETLENRRLGKLNNAAYRDWGTFLTQAGIKMGVSFEDCLTELPDCEKLADDRYRRQMESRLEVLHVLRCLLGPLVESLILLDRYDWLCEELRHTGATTAGNTGSGCNEKEMDVELFNLFDQATGSGRNVAIVIAPR